MTSQDAADLRWALGLRADLIALSFVQSSDDAAPARKIMDELGAPLPLIAKIEKPQAVAKSLVPRVPRVGLEPTLHGV